MVCHQYRTFFSPLNYLLSLLSSNTVLYQIK